MKQEFKNAVDEQNLSSVRMMLSNELLFDPRGKSFEEMLQYAKDNLPNLFEEEKPSRFNIPSDKEEWDNKVLSQMKRDLNMNFSVEKLALFVEMAKFLGSDKARVLEEEQNLSNSKGNDDENRRSTGDRKQEKSINRKGLVVTGSGAVIAITGLCVKGTLGTLGTVLSIVGGAVAIGGVVLLTVPKKTNK